MISVIVPCFNSEAYIEKCIQSLISQDFDRDQYELFFVDNGSIDRTCEILRDYSEIDIFNESTQGSYAARNIGIQAAQGEILAFTDSDCQVAQDWLHTIQQGMQKHGSAIVLGKRLFSVEKMSAMHLLEDYENKKAEYILQFCHKNNYFGYTNNMAVKAHVFKKIGLFTQTHRGSDTEFIQKYLSIDPGSKVTYLKKMVVTHLEIMDVSSWLQKKKIYGESNYYLEKKICFQSLCARHKINLFNICKQKHHGKQNILLYLLMIGNLYYWLGKMKGMLSERSRS